jgi:tetratricopeptide (TPR) repeat protein
MSGRRFGPYLVEARLGGGAMAAVYRAVDQRDGRRVALKVLLPEADDTMRRRFRQEARMASALTHPNIVHTLQISQTTDDNVTFIAMELVEGESLGDLVDRLRTLNAGDSCALLAPVARALAYAHEQGVIHRDVKPSNILLRRVQAGVPHSVRISALDSPVTPLLSDFGIAHALDAPDLTSAGRTIGTPAYMAPEQCASNRDIDGRADIYALGAVLYRCLVGRSPFTGTTTQILYAHVYDPVTIPDDVLRTLSPMLVEILRQSLAKDPAARYPSAEHMADDLVIAAGRPLSVIDTIEVAGAAESTMTMQNLAALPAQTTTSHVIVPAARPAMTTNATPHRPPVLLAPVEMPPAVAVRSPYRRQMVGQLIGIGLVLLVFAIGLVSVRALLPELNPLAFLRADPPQAGVETTPAVVQNGSVATPVSTSLPAVIALRPTAPATVVSAVNRATPTTLSATRSTTTPDVAETPSNQPTSTPTGAGSPTPVPTPVGDIRVFWEDAQAAYEERDWQGALSWLTLAQRIDANFEKSKVERMLFDVLLGLAAESNAKGEHQKAADFLTRALTLQPDATQVSDLLAATQTLLGSSPADRDTAVRLLKTRYADYAFDLTRQERWCDAQEQMVAAIALVPSTRDQGYAASFADRCAEQQQLALDQKALAELSGSLLYSAVRNDRSQVFLMPAKQGGLSQMVIDNGSQPALSPLGTRVAFHSTRTDAQGLAGFDLGAGLDPNARSILFTRFTEDGRDSPPAWNQAGNRLVFASANAGDRLSRVYSVWADGADNPLTLALGQSPAWHWTSDLVVYNGSDPSGQQAGLWLMNSDGTNPRPLTNRSGDIRPTWTPDGQRIIFMSNERDGNWELYQVTIADGQVQRLTDNQAIDALPTIGPDGKWLAFASNRDGGWRVWVRALASGNEFPLAPLSGDLSNVLEHALQWTP